MAKIAVISSARYPKDISFLIELLMSPSRDVRRCTWGIDSEQTMERGRIFLKLRFMIRLVRCVGLYYSGAINFYNYNRSRGKNKGVIILTYHDRGEKSYLSLQVLTLQYIDNNAL